MLNTIYRQVGKDYVSGLGEFSSLSIIVTVPHQGLPVINPLCCNALAPAFPCAVFFSAVGPERKRPQKLALFQRNESVRDFRDFFNISFIDLLFDTICVCIAQ